MREVHRRDGYMAIRIASDDEGYENLPIHCGASKCSYRPRVIYRAYGDDKAYCYGCFGNAHPRLREEPIESPIYLYSEWDWETIDRILRDGRRGEGARHDDLSAVEGG